jgi:hypothetical protein
VLDIEGYNRLQYIQRAAIYTTGCNIYNRLQYIQQAAIYTTGYNIYNRLQYIQQATIQYIPPRYRSTKLYSIPNSWCCWFVQYK